MNTLAGSGYRPLLREVNEGDKPKLLELNIRPADNGYILHASFHGGSSVKVAKKLHEVVEWLNDWELPIESGPSR